MVIAIIGGSGSGKSAYAESLAVSLAGKGTLYYLATMQIYDEEGETKAKRHRELRAGKGFVTIEQPMDIAEAAAGIKSESSTLLLECMSNLAANEMFSQDGLKSEVFLDKEQDQRESLDVEKKQEAEQKQKTEQKQEVERKQKAEKKQDAEFALKIMKDILYLARKSKHLIVVTNNVFEDGIEYDAATAGYMEVLGKVNEGLAEAADVVVEVVAGLPVTVKGAEILCRGESL